LDGAVARLFAPKAGDVEFVRSIHGTDSEPRELDRTGPPDFDGGARETAPLPSDPEADHAGLVLEYLRRLRTYGGKSR
jgi:hypothetical protein